MTQGDASNAHSLVSLNSQKYLLQCRTKEGHWKKVETFDRPIGPGEVLKSYGSGHFVLKSCKPRFKVIWKQHIGQDEAAFQALERKTNYTIGGVAVLTGTQLLGFGLTHGRFCKTEERLDQIETILRDNKPNGLSCGSCGQPLYSLLQKFCGHCGIQLKWPRKPLSAIPNLAHCGHCQSPTLRTAHIAQIAARLNYSSLSSTK
jgi:hypothetical protein